jgi:hypothetical protein
VVTTTGRTRFWIVGQRGDNEVPVVNRRGQPGGRASELDVGQPRQNRGSSVVGVDVERIPEPSEDNGVGWCTNDRGRRRRISGMNGAIEPAESTSSAE